MGCYIEFSTGSAKVSSSGGRTLGSTRSLDVTDDESPALLFAILKIHPSMHIKEQRLLTPGPTPLYPRALHAMMDADLHHRTEDLSNLYRAVLGTQHDVLVLVASGTGAMEASVSNCLSAGDRVIVCTAGKFGERWVEIAKAYGLNAIVLEVPYGRVVSAEAVEQALAANPETKAVFVQASETSTGAAHDVQRMAAAVKNTEAIFVVDAITGLGTMPIDIDGWGVDICIGGSQKAFMIPPGIAFLSVSPKAWAKMDTGKLPRYYFNLKKERKAASGAESAWLPCSAPMPNAPLPKKRPLTPN
jgi:aspartate aminotransferase-like enzyme